MFFITRRALYTCSQIMILFLSLTSYNKADPVTTQTVHPADRPTDESDRGARPDRFRGRNLAAGAGSVWVAPAARDSGQSTGNDEIV